MVSDVTDDIFRSGVPHAVETSVVTKNAINPRNVFIESEQEAQEAVDSPIVFPKPFINANIEGAEQGGADETGPAQDYPQVQESMSTRDDLSVTKSHIQDNIQALHQLAQSDNRQRLSKERFTDNRQAATRENLVSNYQSLGATDHIQENKLYLEKKSIKDNRQKVVEHFERSVPHMVVDPLHASHPELTESSSKQTTGTSKQTPVNAQPNAHTVDDDEFQIRLKKIRANVRDVNVALEDFDVKEPTEGNPNTDKK